jgi:hypothetical protein
MVPTNMREPTTKEPINENPNPEACKKHCHCPSTRAGQDCPCMENRVDCEFEWDPSGRGFCKNCKHGSSLTVKTTDCTLDF